MHDGLKKRLLEAAIQPYQAHRWQDYYWARGKLSHDPVFVALLQQRVLPDNARVLDLGCGRGLLAAWFLAAEQMAGRNQWSSPAAPPQGLWFRGVELDTKRAARCNTGLRAQFGERVDLIGGDMRTVEMGAADAIVMLDALHYIPPADQDRLLDRIRTALDVGGLFIMRIGDAAGGWRFDFSQLVDRCVASLQSRRLVSTWCRPLPAWLEALQTRGFSVQTLPMNDGTLFANALLICRVVDNQTE